MNLFLWIPIFYFVSYLAFFIEQYTSNFYESFFFLNLCISDLCSDLRVQELAKVNLNKDSKEGGITVFGWKAIVIIITIKATLFTPKYIAAIGIEYSMMHICHQFQTNFKRI